MTGWEIAAWIGAGYYLGGLGAAAIAGHWEKSNDAALSNLATFVFVVLWPIWLIVSPLAWAYTRARGPRKAIDK